MQDLRKKIPSLLQTLQENESDKRRVNQGRDDVTQKEQEILRKIVKKILAQQLYRKFRELRAPGGYFHNTLHNRTDIFELLRFSIP